MAWAKGRGLGVQDAGTRQRCRGFGQEDPSGEKGTPMLTPRQESDTSVSLFLSLLLLNLSLRSPFQGPSSLPSCPFLLLCFLLLLSDPEEDLWWTG